MGTITRFRGAYRAFRSDQSLVNTGVSKTVFYGMEEVIGSIPIRSTKYPLHNQTLTDVKFLQPSYGLASFGVKSLSLFFLRIPFACEMSGLSCDWLVPALLPFPAGFFLLNSLLMAVV